MSGSRQGHISDGLAAELVAADPAFAALNASGAPILAAAGAPLTIRYMNAPARALFGDDAQALARRLFAGDAPASARLAELIDSVRNGAALRLERLNFDGDDAAPLTILCRKLTDAQERPLFVLAALGLRPEVAPAAATPGIDAQPEQSEATGAMTALREKLIARHGAYPPRFLWKTDRDGRFTAVSPQLADVVGAANADLVGRLIDEAARKLSLSPAFAEAVRTQRSWSGVSVDWPLHDGVGRAPATLGALPVSDPTGAFCGYQGYGVLHLARAYVTAPAPFDAPPVAPHVAIGVIDYADNVVPLRPPSARAEAARNAPRPVAEENALSETELSAFEEIARALRDDKSDADATPPHARIEIESAPEEKPPPPDDEAQYPAPAPAHSLGDVLERLPVGVLILRGEDTLYINKTLLDYLGYADHAAFDESGGAAHLFVDRATSDAIGKPGPATLRTSRDEKLDVDAHLQTIDWDGAPATLVTLRRQRQRPRGPEESALSLARTLEEKLARARADNALLRAVVETMDAAVAIISDDGRIDSASGALAALLGAEKGEFDGLPLATLFAPEETLTLATRLAMTTQESDQALRLTARALGAPVDVRIRRLPVGDGKICVSLSKAATAVADRELEAARDAAETASAAKSDFLARISHEIRTPLSAIIGFAEVMMEERFGPIGSERYKEYLKDVHASGAHVLSLVNDLLDLSKIEAGKMELSFDRVDANAVIAECVSIMQTQASQERVVMRLALAQSLPPIRADERALRQILLNLLSNAVKYNEPGGQVIVSSAINDAGAVVIRVKDTGIGMTDEEVVSALEPFKQLATARKTRGTGLGLPLTKALIEANQASFIIRSRKNEGTLVEIAFPPPQVMAAE